MCIFGWVVVQGCDASLSIGHITSVTTETRPNDADLCAEAADGNQEAFAQLFDRHVHAVANHCFRWTGSWPGRRI
jgi:hypothetical protein